jgi:hypothetical protein
MSTIPKATHEELEELIEEATVDCYGEEEEFTGIMTMIEENVVFPFEAKVLGETVKIHEFQYPESGYCIKASCESKGKRYAVNVDSIEWVEPLPEGFEWIEAYFYWFKTLSV